jgi:ABC-type oligopeptide transport system substrate-binding subunit
MTFKRLAAAVFACMLGLGLVACSGAAGGSASGHDGTLRVGFRTANPTSLDPAKATPAATTPYCGQSTIRSSTSTRT